MPRPCDHPTGPPRPDECRVCWKYVNVPAYRDVWDRASSARRVVARQAQPPDTGTGPGTELKAMLKGLGFSTCGKCSETAKRMDEGGPSWCRSNRFTIVARLVEARKAAGWLEKLRATGLALSSGLAFSLDPLDPLGSLVDEAIRRAEVRAVAGAIG
jgi:hypothetical protein